MRVADRIQGLVAHKLVGKRSPLHIRDPAVFQQDGVFTDPQSEAAAAVAVATFSAKPNAR